MLKLHFLAAAIAFGLAFPLTAAAECDYDKPSLDSEAGVAVMHGGGLIVAKIACRMKEAQDKVDAIKESVQQRYDRFAGRASGNAIDSSDDEPSPRKSASRPASNRGGSSLAELNAKADIRDKEALLNKQRSLCAGMTAGTQAQVACDLKVACMQDSLSLARHLNGQQSYNPIMAEGQCDGPNPTSAALPHAGDSKLMSLFNDSGPQRGTSSSLTDLMNRQASAEAEEKRQEQLRQQQAAKAEAERQQASRAEAARRRAAQQDDGYGDESSGGMSSLFNAAASALMQRGGSGGRSGASGGSRDWAAEINAAAEAGRAATASKPCPSGYVRHPLALQCVPAPSRLSLPK